MARFARLVVPGLPHHVTQRGNGGARVFFGEADYARYRDLLADGCRKATCADWSAVRVTAALTSLENFPILGVAAA